MRRRSPSWVLLVGLIGATSLLVRGDGPSEGADSAPSTLIKMSDPQVVAGLSPLNWVKIGDSISTSSSGPSINVGFRGTRQVSLAVDTSVDKYSTPVGFPVIAWTVNNGPLQSAQLTATKTWIPLASGVADPVIDLYARGFSPFEDRYTGDFPPNCLRLAGFKVDQGAVAVAAPAPAKLWVNIGDSILSGDAALCAKGQGRPAGDTWTTCSDARATYGHLLADHYGYRDSTIAYGGYDWGGGMASVPILTALIDQPTSTTSRLTHGSWLPRPDVVLINLGQNGPPQADAVIDSLKKLRLRTGDTPKIIVMVPLSGQGRTEVTHAFHTYQQMTGDPRAFLVDLGTISYDMADGTHPTAAGHRAVYEKALPFFDKILSDH